MTTEPIPLSKPDITPAEREAVDAVLRTDRLSMGPHLEAFEAASAQCAGRQFGIGVNSGTSGLHLCVRGLGIGDGDEVLTTPFSFIATTNCLLYEGAKPVFVDIDRESYNLDPAKLEQALTPKTKAILPVEVFGNMAHFDLYEDFAQKHGLVLIEDCCEAIGAVANDRRAGGFGEAGVFAFYPNKQLTTGEGGMIVTDNEDLARAARSMRNQGRSYDCWHYYDKMGFNYRLSEVSAVIGETQLTRLDDILDRRRKVAACYHAALRDIDEISLPPMASPETASWFVYVVRLGDDFGGETRDRVIASLHDQGIGCERYFQAIHTQPFVAELTGHTLGDFPVCEYVADRTIALPFFSSMTAEEVSRVADALKTALHACRQ